MMNKDFFTSGGVARVCNVSNPTAIKWIDSGMLKGFRIPGSKARRVARKDLLVFMSEHDMSLEKLSGVKTKVLVIDGDLHFCKELKRDFILDGSFNELIIQNASMAGTMLDEFRPNIILLDMRLDGINDWEVLDSVEQNTEFQHTKLIGISDLYPQDAATQQGGGRFDGFLKKPFKFNALKEKIHKLQCDHPKPFDTN